MSAQAPAVRVLIVEDSPRDAELTVRELRTSSREIAWERVESATTLREALTRGPWDVILSDYQMPGFDALGVLAVLHESGQDIPCIVISGAIGEETAVAAMRTGARDYLMKGKLARLGPVVDREILQARARADGAAATTASRDELEASRRRFEGLFRRSPVATVIRRASDALIYDANDAYAALTGHAREALVGSTVVDLDILTLEEIERVDATSNESGLLEGTLLSLRTLGGEIRHVRATTVPTKIDGEPHIIATLIDVTDQLAAEAGRLHDATHDRLSGVLNRTAFSCAVDDAIAEAKDTDGSFVLMHIDVDRFADVNAGFGYAGGDELLQQLGSRLAGVIGEGAAIARPGGDEFLVLLPNVGDFAAATLAGERLLDAALQPFTLAGQPMQIDVSIGAALYPDHGSSAEEIVRHAESAVTLASTSGIGFNLYSSVDDPQRPELVSMTGELRTAIAQQQLRLVYQPKVKIGTTEIVGVEALVRWQHPTRGLVSPLEFVPVAERTGLIGPLTSWVLGEALRQCGRWRTAGFTVPVAVNISMRNLREPLFLDTVDRLLRSSGVPATALELEITEGTIMSEPERTNETLRRLHDRGIRLSIDDFGTGYSSLAYLDRLPVHEVKIDRSFVKDVSTHAGHASVVSAVVMMCRIFGFAVIAEGVEDQATADRIQELGCNLMQGYLFSRPVAPAEITAALDAGRWRVARRCADEPSGVTAHPRPATRPGPE